VLRKSKGGGRSWQAAPAQVTAQDCAAPFVCRQDAAAPVSRYSWKPTCGGWWPPARPHRTAGRQAAPERDGRCCRWYRWCCSSQRSWAG